MTNSTSIYDRNSTSGIRKKPSQNNKGHKWQAPANIILNGEKPKASSLTLGTQWCPLLHFSFQTSFTSPSRSNQVGKRNRIQIAKSKLSANYAATLSLWPITKPPTRSLEQFRRYLEVWGAGHAGQGIGSLIWRTRET